MSSHFVMSLFRRLVSRPHRAPQRRDDILRQGAEAFAARARRRSAARLAPGAPA